MLFCTGCDQICGIDDVWHKHLKNKHVVFACKDMAVESYVAVHYLQEVSNLLNQEYKLRQSDFFKVAQQQQEKSMDGQEGQESNASGGNKFLFKFRVAKEIEFIND